MAIKAICSFFVRGRNLAFIVALSTSFHLIFWVVTGRHFQQNVNTSKSGNKLNLKWQEQLTPTSNYHGINRSCNRFAFMGCSGSAGFGHRFGEIVLSMLLADRLNATFVLDDRCWQVTGTHGHYSWFHDFFPFQDSFITWSQMMNFTKPTHAWIDGEWGYLERNMNGDFNRSCDVTFSSRWDMCTGSCFEKASIVGSFDDVKWRFREVYSKSRFYPSVEVFASCKESGSISVALHMRSGDITLNNNRSYTVNVLAQIKSIVSKFPFQVYIFGEDVINNFNFFPEVCSTVLNTSCTFPNISVADTLYHLIQADILVTSGSSFPIAAALFREKKITLTSVPKEGPNTIYETSDDIKLSPDGIIPSRKILDETISRIRILHFKDFE